MTRSKILYSLEVTRSRKPGVSVRNGQAGYLKGKEKRLSGTVIRLKERLRQGSQKNQEELKQTLYAEQECLKKTVNERCDLLSSPGSRWARGRVILPGERGRRHLKPACSGPTVQLPGTEPLREEAPDNSATTCSATEQKLPQKSEVHDYTALYDFWKEHDGPTLTRKDKKRFERCGFPPDEALEEAGKILRSPFLRGRFRSLLWLPHLYKEEIHESRARRETGESLAEAINLSNGTLEDCLKDFPLERVFHTFQGISIVILKKELIPPWVKPWTDKALATVKERKEHPPPELPDVQLDCPF